MHLLCGLFALGALVLGDMRTAAFLGALATVNSLALAARARSDRQVRRELVLVGLASCAVLTLIALCVGGAMLIVRDPAGWYALAAATVIAAAGLASLRSLSL